MLDQRRLEGMIGNWENGIQFTSPRGSLSNAKALLIEVAPMFLKDEKAKMTIAKPRNRRTAARIAATLILEAMERQVPDKAQELVAKNKVLSGQLENHTFDVVLANGKPFAAVHALSFEVDRSANLDRDVESTAWLLEDVRKKHRDMPMAVFLLPPIGVSAPYERAKKLFPKLNGEIVLEQKMPQWARKQAKAFAEHLG